MGSRLLFALIGLLATSLANAQGFIEPTALGLITGIVLTEDGQSTDRARVCVWIKRVSATGNSALGDCKLLTDQLGKFQIEHVKNGTYTLSAAKPEDGYEISGGPVGQQVTISDADPLHVITIKLGPRGGVLTCLVTDKVTGKSIEPDKPTWTERVTIDGSSYPMKASFQAVVAAGTDVSVKATARGYKDWSYSDPANPTSFALRLAPGERRVLKIEMEPVSKN